MNKKIAMLSLGLAFSTIASAKSITSLSAQDAQINAAQIVKVLAQTDRTDGVRISLVLVDSGGSTDISSMMEANTLKLTYWKDGEMCNSYAAFDIAGANEVEVKGFGSAGAELVIKAKNERLSEVKTTIALDYAAFSKAFKNDQACDEEFSNQLVQGTIELN